MMLSIDPGIRATGVALWDDKGTLARAGLVRIPDKAAHPWIKMSDTLIDWIFPDQISRAFIEFPQTYAGRASRGDTNDLLALAGLVGAIHFTIYNGFAIHTVQVRPGEWKGQRPKAVTKANVLEKLTKEELARVDLKIPVSLRHNVFDAVGIGLKMTRR
jgi:hypothetical protein